MIQTLFSFLSPHINSDGKIVALKQLLKKCAAYPHFKKIYEEFGDIEADKISHFILFCFCPDSSFFDGSLNYMDVKNGIAEICGLDVTNHADIISLKLPCVIEAVDYVCYELKSWKAKKMVSLREAAARLEQLSMKEPDAKAKNSAKNIRDAAIYSIELATRADVIASEITKTTRSRDRLLEVASMPSMPRSMEELLREISSS